ncbi:hypothetical protein SAMD00019534_092080 [Acytostelium subglobosum LB1]|uniref:hypothetical protein n=1 Tax=Acytostelium subglobosum LB1 TaxID=1410327 RepID=UPI000644CAF9|nr:hypothetical protein SAMD00019534_092080 [Acytostelium subglobosum LB1]GAM26033.1 hypothetical protein SAMD00019534_092080 [Acytostelium subglobosum LB1]|eukprot:XP_012751076.1 hypothetical protein SAMD00019534_092080 [Acytostelium subglobosum LB1]
MTVHNSGNHHASSATSSTTTMEKTRIILSVRVPEQSTTKKILFDQVESVEEAVQLIVEKLPPGSIDNANNYNIYIPNKSKWCKRGTPFSKYKLKEMQEIEFKRDTRGNMSHLLTSVGQILKPSRTIQIHLPEIYTMGLSTSTLDEPERTSTTSTPRSNLSSSSISLRTSADKVPSPTITVQRPPIAVPPISINNLSSSNISNGSASGSGNSSPSLGRVNTSAMLIPKLNLTQLSASTSNSNASSVSSSPRVAPVLEHRRSLFQIIGISPRTSIPSSPRVGTPGGGSGGGGGGNSPSLSTLTTPRNIGTVAKTSDMRIESFDVDENTSIKELLHKIYARYPHIDREMLDDYNLTTKDGLWLSDRAKTIGDYTVHHNDELRFSRQYQKVRIMFLNREIVMRLTPSDTMAQIAQKLIATANSSLTTTRPSRSPTIAGGTIKTPIPTIITSTAPSSSTTSSTSSNLNSSRSQRSMSDCPPLSFSRSNTNSINSTEHAIDTIKRKNTLTSSSAPPPVHNNTSSSSSSSTTTTTSTTISNNNNNTLTSDHSLLLNGNNNGNNNTETAEFRDYRFYLCIKHPNPTIQHRYDYALPEERTLESFQFWNNVRLQFKNGGANSLTSGALFSRPNIRGGSEVCRAPFYLAVEAPAEPISASCVIEVEATCSISDIVSSFSRMIRSNPNIKLQDNLNEYGIYLDTSEEGKEGIEYGSAILLDPSRLLSSYPIDPMNKLIFKRTNNLFAMNPMLLEQCLDASTSLTVPAFLVQLKQKLKLIDGFNQEGLFRGHATPESTMNTITLALAKKELMAPPTTPAPLPPTSALRRHSSRELDTGCIDAHAIASYIKHWYMKLPCKVCSTLDDEQLTMASSDESKAADIIKEAIAEPYHSLLMWIVGLLADVAQCAATNKMNVKSLSVVMSTILLSNDQPTTGGGVGGSSLERHQKATTLLQHLIKSALREKGFIPLSSSSISINNTTSAHSSTSFMSTTSSVSPITSSLISRSPSLTDISED